jgi:hypothetical protein
VSGPATLVGTPPAAFGATLVATVAAAAIAFPAPAVAVAVTPAPVSLAAVALAAIVGLADGSAGPRLDAHFVGARAEAQEATRAFLDHGDHGLGP